MQRGNSPYSSQKSLRVKAAERVMTINDNNNKKNQFLVTPIVIEVRRNELKELPLDELA
jgi:hypothetical protein